MAEAVDMDEAQADSAAKLRATVIVLGYHGWHYVEPCLESLLDQDFAFDSYEILYVDNKSLDESAPRVREKFPQVRVLELDHNYGYAEGNNKGFAAARGEYVVFLNEDTEMHRSWLTELLTAVSASPDIAAAHANIIQPWYPEFDGIDERSFSDVAYTSEVNRLGYVQYEKLPASAGVVDTLFLHGVCIILRRDVGEELQYIFDPDFFAYAEDLDLGLRVRSLGYRSVVASRAIVYHKHTLQTAANWLTIVKTVRIIRNRYLAFFKVMAGWEFVAMAAILTVGAPFNSGEFGLGRVRQVVYGVALVPATLAALVTTLFHLPRYVEKRRWIRDHATQQGAWCLRALWSRRTA
jgi:GT2 family glycosyltransferase